MAGAGLYVAKKHVAHQYNAAAVLEWEPEGAAATERELRTLVESVKLPQNLAAVRTKLDLPLTLEQVSHRVEVAGNARSSFVTITAHAEEAVEAALIADALASQFLEHRKTLRAQELRERSLELGGSIASTRRALQTARDAFDAFREKHHITDLPAEQRIALDQASRAASEAELAQADVEAEAARTRTLRGAIAGISRMTVRGETQSDPAASRLADARAELTQLRARLSDEHPKVQALQAEVAALEKNKRHLTPMSTQRTVGIDVRWEVAQSEITGSEASRVAARERREALDAQAHKAQERLQWLSGLEGERNALVAELRAHEAHLALLLEAKSKADDEVGHPKPGARLVSKPSVPRLPSKSWRKLVAIAFVAVGFVGAVVMALVRALWGLRAHTAREAAFAANLPVVASSGWNGDRDDAIELARLVDDTLEVLPYSTKELVVLPASDDERTLVGPIADAVSNRYAGAVSGWDGADVRACRRVARAAGQVLVVVRSGARGALQLAQITSRLGRRDNVFIAVVGLGPELANFTDRCGVDEGDANVTSLRPQES